MAALNVETLTPHAPPAGTLPVETAGHSTLTAPVQVPAEPTTPIKPSEALRLGRLVRSRRITGNEIDGTDGACARGAMGEAIGVDRLEDPFLWHHWPDLLRDVPCPCEDRACFWRKNPASVSMQITNLNDSGHGWSDDQIVAWLQSLGL